MAKKLMSWKTKGMNRDLSVSAFNPEFAFENMNLRLSTNEGNTMMSWVNEKGTALITVQLNLDSIKVYHPQAVGESENDYNTRIEGIADAGIQGHALGTAILNNTLVIFTTTSYYNQQGALVTGIDYIYCLNYTGSRDESDRRIMEGKLLFEGNMDLDLDYPLETLVSYESEQVQKVYWTDNKNQPRLINIAATIPAGGYNEGTFDFVSTLQLKEEVTIQKMLGASGMFAPGVIQYAFTYFNKYSQESNIFYISPLLYISFKDRGASPEEKVDNAFKITIDKVDKHFDYIRVYSIQRTSIDATPIVKRVQDIKVDGRTRVDYIDTGINGDSVVPTELLYKGGETVAVKTMEQKDNTLFLGNLSITRPRVEVEIEGTDINVTSFFMTGDLKQQYRRTIYPTDVSSGTYKYASQLTAFSDTNKTVSVPCAGFKRGDYYRCGVQFQYKTGIWSDPIFIKDEQIVGSPIYTGENSDLGTPTSLQLPVIKGYLKGDTCDVLIEKGYIKVRPVVVYPNIQDRCTICQGIANKTLYTLENTNTNALHGQASWFFRPYKDGGDVDVDEESSTKGAVYPTSEDLIYMGNELTFSPANIKKVEIQGTYDSSHVYKTQRDIFTLNSPDVEFDTQLSNLSYSSLSGRLVGLVDFKNTLSDISIQTESPTISRNGAGFIHKTFNAAKSYGISSGLFYDDYIADDDDNTIRDWKIESHAAKWMVYLWNKSGSLNNDIVRPSNLGTASAVLKKKVISNLRYTDTTFQTPTTIDTLQDIQLFSSNEVSVVKLKEQIYQGNIDTLLSPTDSDGMYLAIDEAQTQNVDFSSSIEHKTFAQGINATTDWGLYKYTTGSGWNCVKGDMGERYRDLVIKKEGVRMKYKSTPHLAILDSKVSTDIAWNGAWNEEDKLPIIEIGREFDYDTVQAGNTSLFGGKSSDALRENIWIPCGEPVRLDKRTITSLGEVVEFEYSYGDTYYQRWDCLKTYPFTPEDINQVVEIGSFMLETRVNIDGRYDRNRGQLNNLNMTPQNFNLINPVYSQLNNFFTYRILDEDYYKSNKYPNQVVWSKAKQSGADVDLWTNITLSSSMELDGDKGQVNKLVRWDNQLICLQDTGISQILYNENTQISTEAGVPVEIANSDKVQGKRYISNSIGCSNKWSVAISPQGLYFLDSHNKGIFRFNGQLQNVSASLGFSSWAQCIPTAAKDITWTPDGFNDFVTYYDKKNQDVLFISNEECLAYSERFGVFTSFYSYEGVPYLCNLLDTGIWLRNVKNNNTFKTILHNHNEGGYCRFFDAAKPYHTILVGNPEPQADKIFTNLEFRATVDGDGTTKTVDNEEILDKFYLPFNTLETWDEYQRGWAQLDIRDGHAAMIHHPRLNNDASLKRKFRIWRCDIPRDNADLGKRDADLNISRYKKHPMDRMRNPWIYLKLTKDYEKEEENLPRVEVHDFMMTYYV